MLQVRELQQEVAEAQQKAGELKVAEHQARLAADHAVAEAESCRCGPTRQHDSWRLLKSRRGTLYTTFRYQLNFNTPHCGSAVSVNLTVAFLSKLFEML